jgi:hypothetical protein
VTGFSVSSNLSKIIEIDVGCGVARSLESLRSSGAPYGVIIDHAGPLSLIAADALEALADRAASLADLVTQLPPLVTMPGQPDILDVPEIVSLARVIHLCGAAAVLVQDDDQYRGALPRRCVASALPLATLTVTTRRSGPPQVGSLRFICRQCVPPTYRLPRSSGSEAPVCRRSYFHGPMELLQDEA